MDMYVSSSFRDATKQVTSALTSVHPYRLIRILSPSCSLNRVARSFVNASPLLVQYFN